jgi:hypothetical protein
LCNIIHEIIQPVYQIRNQQLIKNLIGQPDYEKNVIIIDYPINSKNLKYLQNIDQIYIKKCFEKAEQEYLKRINVYQEYSEESPIVVNDSKIEDVPKYPFHPKTKVENTNLASVKIVKPFIQYIIHPIRQQIFVLFFHRIMKVITKKKIEIILKDMNFMKDENIYNNIMMQNQLLGIIQFSYI